MSGINIFDTILLLKNIIFNPNMAHEFSNKSIYALLFLLVPHPKTHM
tara:strand:+ start:20067 stop:20207 length:141 start_codon:yes stop_codon:yes gene_type:complete